MLSFPWLPVFRLPCPTVPARVSGAASVGRRRSVILAVSKPWNRTLLFAGVAKSAKSIGKLCTRSPSAVCFLRALASARADRWPSATTDVRLARSLFVVVEHDWCRHLPHVPPHAVRQYARQHVRPHLIHQTMMDRQHLQVHRLEATRFDDGPVQLLVRRRRSEGLERLSEPDISEPKRHRMANAEGATGLLLDATEPPKTCPLTCPAAVHGCRYSVHHNQQLQAAGTTEPLATREIANPDKME